MDDFLTRAGWADATRTAITPDWSPRHFWRLTKEDSATAVLMHAPADIPGHGLDDFAHYAGILRRAGLSAPDIYASAPGYLLIEDFGETPIDTPEIERAGYECAIDTLAVMRTIPCEGLTRYKDAYIYKKLALYNADSAWTRAWEDAEKSLPPCPLFFSHMDYKAGNLHWLPVREGVRRIGILDFQAAQAAPFVYDLVNLLEDARRNLAPSLKADLKRRFFNALPDDCKPLFEDWYVFMSAQFHARVLGQITGNARVAPDVAPRLKGYLRNELMHPLLADVRGLMRDL